MAETQAAPDLTKVPNFDALDGWMNRLQDWCEAARDEIVNGPDAEEYNRMLLDLEEMGPKAENFDELVELVIDIGRGIRTLGEIVIWLRGKGFEV
jgi:hypothetical protein